jgi:hypothetical protein
MTSGERTIVLQFFFPVATAIGAASRRRKKKGKDRRQKGRRSDAKQEPR